MPRFIYSPRRIIYFSPARKARARACYSILGDMIFSALHNTVILHYYFPKMPLLGNTRRRIADHAQLSDVLHDFLCQPRRHIAFVRFAHILLLNYFRRAASNMQHFYARRYKLIRIT